MVAPRDFRPLGGIGHLVVEYFNRIVVLCLISFTTILILLAGASFIRAVNINIGLLACKSWYPITSSLLHSENVR
jgi:hypothetical protein